MARRPKYKLPPPRNNPNHSAYWLLTAGLLVLFGWIWWHSGKSAVSKPTVVKSLPAVKTSLARRAAPPVAVRVAIPVVAPIAASSPPPSPSPPPIYRTNTAAFPRSVQNLFEAQVALAREGISSGSIDGVIGPQTRAALAAYQRQEHLPPTGELDAATKGLLLLAESADATFTVTSNDLARLQPIAATWLGKSRQSALDYETILELVAERTFAHPNLIRRLNPSVNWTNVAVGTVLQVPNVAYPPVQAQAAFVTISLSAKVLEAFDAATNLLAHFPCSIARRVEKRPVGELHVVVVAPNPNYTFDPEVFPESAEARELNRKLVLPPGPNNPVGVAWIGLDRPGYGIHGTPRPEDVGRTESHGCFRLANWNAEYLLRLITIGTPVYVVE